MMYSDVVRDFACRTWKNLEVLESIQKTKGDAFEVTQLINSMLGLLIFPQQEFVDSIPETSIPELEASGWPIPRVIGGFPQVNNLNQLIRYLRNAVAHFHIRFIGDGQNEIALLRMWNMKPVRNSEGRLQRNSKGVVIEEKNWEVELGVNELRGIVNRFIGLLLEQQQ